MSKIHEERRRSTNEEYYPRNYRSDEGPSKQSLSCLALGSLLLLGVCKLYDTVKEAITGKKNTK